MIDRSIALRFVTIRYESLRLVTRVAKQEEIASEKMQEAYQLLGEETNAIITYLENVLNANNIRYNLELA